MSDTTVTRERIRAIRPRVAPRLVVVWPRTLGDARPLARTQVIGRATPAELVLDHPTVSRSHASLTLRDAGLMVADLGSRNGTALNGAALGDEPQIVRSGDVLRFGDVFAVVVDSADEGLPGDDLFGIPGHGPAMVVLRRRLRLAATDGAPLLIVGPTGSGKEAIARAAHALSGRSGPFVAVNCAELSGELVESQLFGHERGAFTGAGEARPGLFRAASRGTLFLDEIGELSLELQPKLLRVIQEREVRPVGATRAVPIDVRLVTATHRDLSAAVEEGRFRRDLWARLALWEVSVPPLSERREDILAWLDLFTARFHDGKAAARPGSGSPFRFDLHADAVERLLLSPWTENLRGVDRVVHRLHDRALPFSRVVASDLDGMGIDPAPAPTSVDVAKTPRPDVPTKEVFVAAYEAHGGSVHGLARHFGRDRRQIYRWIAAWGLDTNTS